MLRSDWSNQTCLPRDFHFLLLEFDGFCVTTQIVQRVVEEVLCDSLGANLGASLRNSYQALRADALTTRDIELL